MPRLGDDEQLYVGSSLIELVATAPLLDITFEASLDDLHFPVAVSESVHHRTGTPDGMTTFASRAAEDFLPTAGRVKAIAGLLGTLALQVQKDSKNENGSQP